MTTTTTTTHTSSAAAPAAPHMNTVRQHLLDTLADLRNRDKPMEIDRARAVAQIASVLVDTAKVEIDYLKATGQDHTSFLEQPADLLGLGNTPGSGYSGGTVQRLPGVTKHRMGG